MFVILVDNTLLDFWSNQVGDTFIENTIKNLNLDASKVMLLKFDINSKPEVFAFDGNNLLIQEEVVTETPSEVEGEPPTKVTTRNTLQTLTPEIYYNNGTSEKAC